MSTEKLLRQYRRQHVDDAARDAGAVFDHLLFRCDSPIEQLLLAALIARGVVSHDVTDDGHGWHLMKRRCLDGIYPKIFMSLYDRSLVTNAWLFGQFPIAESQRSMRIDFAIVIDWEDRFEGLSSGPAWLAVECDGHDFHERTKQQAARDRSRDRLLTAAGWHAVRFTGSELYANADGCVDELIRIAASTDPRRSKGQ